MSILVYETAPPFEGGAGFPLLLLRERYAIVWCAAILCCRLEPEVTIDQLEPAKGERPIRLTAGRRRSDLAGRARVADVDVEGAGRHVAVGRARS